MASKLVIQAGFSRAACNVSQALYGCHRPLELISLRDTSAV
jgi:hypothetical protein